MQLVCAQQDTGSLEEFWNPDIYNAMMLFLNGFPQGSEPTPDMPPWMWDAVSLMQTNNIVALIGTPEATLAIQEFILFH